jgi:hypothetical protein
MNLDQELRTTLRERAETYRPSQGLMAAVRGRQRQHRRRRTVVAAALTVAVAVAAPLAAVALRWVPTPVVAPMLVAPAAAPSFPVTPGWEPDWVGLRSFTYERSATGVTAVLRYEPTFPFRAELAVVVSDQSPSLTGETIQFGEHSATLATANGRTSLVWPLGAAWIRVEVNDRVSRDELILFAASLTDRPLPMALPFSLTAVPENAELVAFDRYTMVYRKVLSDAQITTSVVSRGAVPAPASTVDGLAVVVDAASITAYHAVDGDRAVRVQATAGWDLTEAQVTSIARGVGITAVALTTGG